MWQSFILAVFGVLQNRDKSINSRLGLALSPFASFYRWLRSFHDVQIGQFPYDFELVAEKIRKYRCEFVLLFSVGPDSSSLPWSLKIALTTWMKVRTSDRVSIFFHLPMNGIGISMMFRSVNDRHVKAFTTRNTSDSFFEFCYRKSLQSIPTFNFHSLFRDTSFRFMKKIVKLMCSIFKLDSEKIRLDVISRIFSNILFSKNS